MATRDVKLTAEQRRRVRELMVDEESRASAVAWVLAFEPAAKVSR